jgi:chorismate-pyruvate lyase
MSVTSLIARPPLWCVARFVVIGALLASAPLVVFAQASSTWSDTFESRLEILALMQTLNADILASPSATLILERWCRNHKMTDDPRIVARSVKGFDKVPTPEQLQRLQVAGINEVKYRRVELRCGRHVLSGADNWYVPGRLTAEMNNLLETTDTPFGKAIQALRPYRRTYAVTILWSPLSAGWEQEPRARSQPRRPRKLAVPKNLFEHRAIIYTSDNKPFSEVNEVYQGEILAFQRARQSPRRRRV